MTDDKRLDSTKGKGKAAAEFLKKDWVKELVAYSGKPITERPKAQSEQPGATFGNALVDFLFVIDTTGSMSDKIDRLLQTCRSFADECKQYALDPQFTLIAFGDLTVPGDDIVVTVRAGSIEDFKKGLSTVPTYSGGANGGESALDAVLRALEVPCRRGAVKMIVLITDEAPLEHGQVTASSVTATLVRKEYMVYTVSPDMPVYREMAQRTGGTWCDIYESDKLSDLLTTFRTVAAKTSSTARAVHQLGGGSVKEYLRLAPPSC